MSWIAEVKAKHTIVSAFALLGMEGRRMRYGPCPACNAERTAQDSRPPVRASGRHSWWCNACQQNGDILDLVSYSLWGYSSKQADFKELKKFFLDRDHIKPPEYKPDDNMSKHPPQGQVKWLLDEAYLMDDHQTPDKAGCVHLSEKSREIIQKIADENGVTKTLAVEIIVQQFQEMVDASADTE